MSRWIQNDAEWYEQRQVHCGCCGRLIAKHFYVAEIDDKEQIFCGEACKDLYRVYLLPERGEHYRSPADVLDRYERLMIR